MYPTVSVDVSQLLRLICLAPTQTREMSVIEQKYKAVLAVIGDGRTVGEVARDDLKWPDSGRLLSRVGHSLWSRRHGSACFAALLDSTSRQRPQLLAPSNAAALAEAPRVLASEMHTLAADEATQFLDAIRGNQLEGLMRPRYRYLVFCVLTAFVSLLGRCLHDAIHLMIVAAAQIEL